MNPLDDYKGWLDIDWLPAYGAYSPQVGSANYLDYWRNKQSDLFDQFIGAQGTLARQGVSPASLSQTSFLQTYPFYDEWMKLAPSMKGTTRGRFAPQTTWRF